MPTKRYDILDAEPAVAYLRRDPDVSGRNVRTDSNSSWNPNVPFHGTQDEWWEHFHRIEEGNFMTLEEFDHKFETWKTKYLASKLR